MSFSLIFPHSDLSSSSVKADPLSVQFVIWIPLSSMYSSESLLLFARLELCINMSLAICFTSLLSRFKTFLIGMLGLFHRPIQDN